jgi:ATP-dependent DNA helicase RecG
MTKEALDFIDRNFITETIIKYPNRAEADRVKNYPFAAIEEAVVNAVYHRSYEIREPIEIRIYQDEIIILSYPGPDRSVKLESFEKGRVNSRRYRNRRIGEFFKDLKMTEGRSTGIKKIIDAMAENGSPKPHFEFDEEHTYFQVTLPIHETVKHQMRLTGGTPAEQNIIILEYIRKHGFIKRENVEQLLQVKDSRAREILKKMADSGQVIKVGTGKNTCYEEVN